MKFVAPSIDPAHYRHVLGHFPTGVVIVTASGESGPAGFAIGSFTSVSLDPPLVGFLPAKSSTSFPKVRDAGAFCVNVLAADQQDLCGRFASSGGDKFSGVPWSSTRTGSPRFQGVVAWIDCVIESTVEAGDHWFVLGRVVDLNVDRTIEPLVFHRGGYSRLTP